MSAKVKRALISVSNKEGLVEFVKDLQKLNVEIVSTGGTYKKIKDSGLNAIKVEDLTGFPEMMNGRVKTLHPNVHGGILADRSNKDHMNQANEMEIELIDMVVVNLYPFRETISKDGVTVEDAIENIDIGGPTMIRSAAKNSKSVAVVVDPADYKKISDELSENDGCLGDATLAALSVKAFQHTCEYDSVIFNYFINRKERFEGTDIDLRPSLEISGEINRVRDADGKFNKNINISLNKIQDLRYGENPHQNSAYYKLTNAPAGSLVNSKQLQGKELSYNNILDVNAAFGIVREFNEYCVSVIKHNNPCGAAISDSVVSAYEKAYSCDPVSAYGSVVASNHKWTAQAAQFMSDKYVEVVIAPDYEEEALKILSEKKNLRVLKINFDLGSFTGNMNNTDFQKDYLDFKSIDGGLLVQDLDIGSDNIKDFKVATEKKPDSDQLKDLYFCWQVIKNVKSNAIVFAKDGQLVGVGAGQMSRVDSVKIAIEKSEGRCDGSVMASDAFFPFPDAIEAAIKNGIKAVIQPGGSIRDDKVIESCNKNKIPMVFTGRRHFKH